MAEQTASMILADLGADVIKVESLTGGEDGLGMAHRGPWVALNQGNQSLALDITLPAGRDVLGKRSQPDVNSVW